MPFEKVENVLKFKDKGLSVEDAKKAMLAAGEAPKGMIGVPTTAVEKQPPVVPRELSDELEPEIEITEQVTVTRNPHAAAQAVEAATVQPVVEAVKPPVIVQPPQVERVETQQFVGEIKQEDGRWVAEIRYKNGAGTEKFFGDSKNDLLLKLLEGKGHATIRVKEAVRREKLGSPKLDKAYPLPDNITSEQFEALPDWQKSMIIENIAAQQALVWREQCPDYYKTQANGEALDNFLKQHDLPWTIRNLNYAFEDLRENDMFPDKWPEQAAAKILAQAPIVPKVEDSTPVPPANPVPTSSVPEKPAEPTVVVRKRGSTGLQPGNSSAPSGASTPEDGGGPRELSEAELRKLPMSELKRIATADRRARASTR